jgi:hypothetical protein
MQAKTKAKSEEEEKKGKKVINKRVSIATKKKNKTLKEI